MPFPSLCRGSRSLRSPEGSLFFREQGAEMVATVWKVNAFKPTEPSTSLRCLAVSQKSRQASPSCKFAPSRDRILHCTEITGAKQKGIHFNKQTGFLVSSSLKHFKFHFQKSKRGLRCIMSLKMQHLVLQGRTPK